MCNIWIIHLFNALSSITLVIRVTQIRSGSIYHKLVYYIYIQLKLIYPYYLCLSLEDIYLHINYIILLSHKYVCRILKSVLFVFVHHTRACTCSIISYLLYMYMYNAYIRMFKAVHATDIIHVHSHNFHILIGNLVRGGWMLLEGNQHQKFKMKLIILYGYTVYIMFTVYGLLLHTLFVMV